MKIIITENQYGTLIEGEVSNELLVRIWDYELGPAIFETLSSNGIDGSVISRIVKERDYDHLHRLLIKVGEKDLARRLKMFVKKVT